MTDPRWRKATFSADNGCVELAKLGHGLIGVRDSKHPDAGHLTISRGQLAVVLDAVSRGEIDDLG